MTPAKMPCASFLPAQKYRRLLREYQARWSNVGRRVRLLMFQDVGPRIRRRDDIGGGEELGIAAAMVRMMMGAEHIFHRLIGDALNFRDDGVVISVELVIHQNHALVCNQY